MSSRIYTQGSNFSSPVRYSFPFSSRTEVKYIRYWNVWSLIIINVVILLVVRAEPRHPVLSFTICTYPMWVSCNRTSLDSGKRWVPERNIHKGWKSLLRAECCLPSPVLSWVWELIAWRDFLCVHCSYFLSSPCSLRSPYGDSSAHCSSCWWPIQIRTPCLHGILDVGVEFPYAHLFRKALWTILNCSFPEQYGRCPLCLTLL